MSETHSNTPRRDLTDREFGRLIVLRFVGYKNKSSQWLCLCVCGNERVVSAAHLGRDTNSCGCLRIEMSAAKNRTHGMSGTPEHNTWLWIIQRTSNPQNKRFGDYGERGIRLCERWRSFENFLADMGLRPSPQHSIERKDNNGDYEPGNCEWATNEQQAANRRSNINLSLNGETHHLAEWSRRIGVKRATLEYRWHAGWDDAKILTTPVRH